ncbi:2553_t:CDS:2, partial [Acaulospora morrowiae]
MAAESSHITQRNLAIENPLSWGVQQPYSSWSFAPTSYDSKAPNSWTPPLNQPFPYGKQPVRGVNLGGWLVLEPFITPSLFNASGVVDEYTLCASLGPDAAKETLDNHYSTFITEQDFADIAQAGLDHVRIPFGHWAIGTTADEPYVPKLSWDYLLKGIEWARKYGLRVLVELHTAPGSQNGWNHSGRQGNINWLLGPNGTANADRTLSIIREIISSLNSPNYQHVVPLISHLNEPRVELVGLNALQEWYQKAYDVIQNITAKGPLQPWVLYSDGMAGLSAWKGFMKGYKNVALDTHQYLIFDPNLMK